jgi:hypothetical protein
MGHAPGRCNGAGAMFCLRHSRRSRGWPGQRGIAIEPSLYLGHGDDPQAAPADDPKLRLDMALEGRLAHTDGFGGLLDR